jgi:hypothetical protein
VTSKQKVGQSCKWIGISKCGIAVTTSSISTSACRSENIVVTS